MLKAAIGIDKADIFVIQIWQIKNDTFWPSGRANAMKWPLNDTMDFSMVLLYVQRTYVLRTQRSSIKIEFKAKPTCHFLLMVLRKSRMQLLLTRFSAT